MRLQQRVGLLHPRLGGCVGAGGEAAKANAASAEGERPLAPSASGDDAPFSPGIRELDDVGALWDDATEEDDDVDDDIFARAAAAVGRNDGSVEEIRYFSCQPSHGLFVKPDKVRPLSQPAGRASVGAASRRSSAGAEAVEPPFRVDTSRAVTERVEQLARRAAPTA
ncbi:MAG: CAP-Gly domain-containing protein, partial [Pseudomonadota bacterium]|nr:CAP-Gly domain-containing protein [Pseudomonadota bacterium]